MVSFAEYPGDIAEVEDAVWVRDYPELAEGFSDDFINDDPLYCSKRDNVVSLTWDSLGHFQVPAGDDERDLNPSSSSSSSSSSSTTPQDLTACYAVGIIGRFNEGPCSSSSLSSSCESSSFCQDDDHRLKRTYALEETPKDLKLCFDDLGHLTGVYVCGRLRWHQDGWYEGISSAVEVMDVESSSGAEGVEIVAYLLMPEPSSSSSSCDTPYQSICEPMLVRKVTLTFDGLGHLFMVWDYEEVEVPCGIQTECCDDAMPRSFLVTFKHWNKVFGDLARVYADEQCQVVHWNGCWWPGAVSINCCVRSDPGSSAPPFVLSEFGVPFKIGCTKKPGMVQPPDNWRLCLGDQVYGFLEPNFNCCPLDGYVRDTYTQDGCDDVEFEMTLSEIPCNIQCVSGTFDCDSPSSTSPDEPSGSEGPGEDPGPPFDCPVNWCKYEWNPEGGLGMVGQWEYVTNVGCSSCVVIYPAPPPEPGQSWFLYVCCSV